MKSAEWINVFDMAKVEGIVQTCRKLHINRSQYYKKYKRFKAEGIEGLEPITIRCRICKYMTNQDFEDAVLSVVRNNPKWGARKIAEYLSSDISPSYGTVHKVLVKSGLSSRENRESKYSPKGSIFFVGLHKLEDGRTVCYAIERDFGLVQATIGSEDSVAAVCNLYDIFSPIKPKAIIYNSGGIRRYTPKESIRSFCIAHGINLRIEGRWGNRIYRIRNIFIEKLTLAIEAKEDLKEAIEATRDYCNYSLKEDTTEKTANRKFLDWKKELSSQ